MFNKLGLIHRCCVHKSEINAECFCVYLHETMKRCLRVWCDYKAAVLIDRFFLLQLTPLLILNYSSTKLRNLHNYAVNTHTGINQRKLQFALVQPYPSQYLKNQIHINRDAGSNGLNNVTRVLFKRSRPPNNFLPCRAVKGVQVLFKRHEISLRGWTEPSFAAYLKPERSIKGL